MHPLRFYKAHPSCQSARRMPLYKKSIHFVTSNHELLMKRILLYTLAVFSAFCAFADLGDNGYYRVQNAASKRFAYLLDDKGSIDATGSTADVTALELFLDPDKIYSDPSCIFHVKHIDSSSSKYYYDIEGQGTSVHGFLGEYVKIIKDKAVDNVQAYLIYASKSGMTKYLGDRRSDTSMDSGWASVDVSGDRRLWHFHPVNVASNDNYFGISADLNANGKYYYPFFADFPFKAESAGMKFYIVTGINPQGVVIIEEVKGIIPASTPVIVECSHPLAVDNKLSIGGTASALSSENLLKGVYFNNDDVIHRNRLAYDKKTMRSLMVKNGKLVFGVGNYSYVPRNQAYLQLTDAAQYNISDFILMTQEEFDEAYGAVGSIPVSAVVDVYSLDGRLVKAGIAKDQVSSVGKGLYIVRCDGVSEKVVVR